MGSGAQSSGDWWRPCKGTWVLPHPLTTVPLPVWNSSWQETMGELNWGAPPEGQECSPLSLYPASIPPQQEASACPLPALCPSSLCCRRQENHPTCPMLQPRACFMPQDPTASGCCKVTLARDSKCPGLEGGKRKTQPGQGGEGTTRGALQDLFGGN